MNYIKLAKDKYYNAPLVNKKRITLKQVNDAIQKVYPTVFLVKDRNYFFIASDDNEWGLKIAGLYQSSIYVAKLNQLTIDQWVDEVKVLFENKTHFYYEKQKNQ